MGRKGVYRRQLQTSTLCSAGLEGGPRMSVESVRTFFAYGRWANRRLLEAAGELSADELDFDLRGCFASIKGTLRHLLWAERSWFRFWREDDFGPDLSPTDFPDLASIVDGWAALE